MADREPYDAPDHVACLNRSTLSDLDLALWVEAGREECKRLCDAWELAPPGLAVYPASHTEEPDPSVAVIYIVDSAGDPDALGYHTAVGRSRFGYVDMALSAAYDIPSVVFFHELWELIVDADCDRWVGYPEGVYIPIEVADPCQRDSYGVKATFLGSSGNVQVADFALPSWFQPRSAAPYDHLGRIEAPLADAPGGYHLVEKNGVLVSEGRARLKSYGRSFRRLIQGRAR